MIEHLREYWWMYWSVGVAAALLSYRYRRTDTTRSGAARIRSLMAGNRYYDPESPSHDPGLFGRQIGILAVGLPLVALALLVVWLLER